MASMKFEHSLYKGTLYIEAPLQKACRIYRSRGDIQEQGRGTFLLHHQGRCSSTWCAAMPAAGRYSNTLRAAISPRGRSSSARCVLIYRSAVEMAAHGLGLCYQVEGVSSIDQAFPAVMRLGPQRKHEGTSDVSYDEPRPVVSL